MAVRLDDRDWLAGLVDEELAAYDADGARARLPADALASAEGPSDLAAGARLLVARSLRRVPAAGTGPDASLLEEARGHVALALDLAALRRLPFVRARARAELAALLAAAVGADTVARAVEPQEPGGASDVAVARALRVAGRVLLARFHPPVEPPGGLPIRPGALAVLRRRLARTTVSYLRQGRLDRADLTRHGLEAARESALLAEALAGLLRAAAEPTERDAALRVRQVSHLGLGRDEARTARRRTLSPRPPGEIAADAPPETRPVLLEELRLAQLRRALAGPGPEAWLEAFARGTGLAAPAFVAAGLEAAARHGGHEELSLVPGPGRGWTVVAEEWEAATDQVIEKVSEVVTGNLEALVTELRETGELGQLVAKAAAGVALSDDERRKVREQLVDLAKAVPALAIFAAPGGALLLPLLAKLLPFSILPSAWGKGAAPGTATLIAAPASPAGPAREPADATVAAAAASIPAARPR